MTTPNTHTPADPTPPASASRSTEAEVPGPFPFNRRRMPRSAVQGRGVMIFAGTAGLRKMCGVRYIDSSPSGLGVESEMEIKIGTHFTLYPESGLMPSRSGRVVRCEPTDSGWRLGLQTSQRAVA